MNKANKIFKVGYTDLIGSEMSIRLLQHSELLNLPLTHHTEFKLRINAIFDTFIPPLEGSTSSITLPLNIPELNVFRMENYL